MARSAAAPDGEAEPKRSVLWGIATAKQARPPSCLGATAKSRCWPAGGWGSAGYKLVSKLSVSGPEPGGETKTVPMRQIAPGRYEARLPLAEYGSFLLRAEHQRQQDNGTLAPVAVSYGHVSNPYPTEYASFETDFGTLERVALATGGRSEPKEWRQLFDPEGEQIKFDQELWPRAVMAAIGIYLLDLLLRRVRLFDRKFLPRRRKRKVLAA